MERRGRYVDEEYETSAHRREIDDEVYRITRGEESERRNEERWEERRKEELERRKKNLVSTRKPSLIPPHRSVYKGKPKGDSIRKRYYDTTGRCVCVCVCVCACVCVCVCVCVMEARRQTCKHLGRRQT